MAFVEKTIRKIVLRIPWHRLLSCSPWPLSYYRRTQVSVCCQCVMISAVILPQFGEGRFPTGVLQPNSQWLYNNYYELELIEPPNKDGYLGSFHEMLGNRVSLNTRKLQVWGEEVLESFFSISSVPFILVITKTEKMNLHFMWNVISLPNFLIDQIGKIIDQIIRLISEPLLVCSHLFDVLISKFFAFLS